MSNKDLDSELLNKEILTAAISTGFSHCFIEKLKTIGISRLLLSTEPVRRAVHSASSGEIKDALSHRKKSKPNQISNSAKWFRTFIAYFTLCFDI